VSVQDAPPLVAVALEAASRQRDAIDGALAGLAEVTYLSDLDGEPRRRAIDRAKALLTWSPAEELRPGECEAARDLELVQLLSAGFDHVDAADLPARARLAGNVGAYAEPMAEHVLAMVLALAKRLPRNHLLLRDGRWPQAEHVREVAGSVLGVLGFGGIGRAVARLARPLGMKVHALNRGGRTDEPIDWIGTPADLDTLLGAADALVVALPLTPETRGLIGARELGLMKPAATLVNVARGAIVEEDALYEHLRTNPDFSAGIDSWWREPDAGEPFRPERDFLALPNALGSPHNSAMVPRIDELGARRAAENVARLLRGEEVRGLVDPSLLERRGQS
jgi:phosphoglycerate dehydrogenase-like enzyme